RKNQDPVEILICHRAGTTDTYNINQNRDYGSRNGNPDIDSELVTQLYTLTGCGGYRCVGNHRQVITEHGATHNCSNCINYCNIRCLTKTKSNWRTGCNSPHRGPHCRCQKG